MSTVKLNDIKTSGGGAGANGLDEQLERELE